MAATMTSVEVWAGADRLRMSTSSVGLGTCLCDPSVLIVVIRGPSGSGQTSMLRTLCEHCAHLPYWLEQIWATSGNLTVDLATADFIVPSQFDPGSAPPTGAPRQR